MKKTRREIHGGNKIMKKVKGQWVAALCFLAILGAPIAVSNTVLAEVPESLELVFNDEFSSKFDKKADYIEEKWVQEESQKALDLVTNEEKINTVDEIKEEIERQKESQKDAELDLPIYVIQFGDELPKIADAYEIEATELSELNQLKDPNQIVIGDILILPSESFDVIEEKKDSSETTTDIKSSDKAVSVTPSKPSGSKEQSEEQSKEQEATKEGEQGEQTGETPVAPKPETPVVTEEPTKPTPPVVTEDPVKPAPKPETTVEVPVDETTKEAPVVDKPIEPGEEPTPEETTSVPGEGEVTIEDIEPGEITEEPTETTVEKPEETTVETPEETTVDDHGPNSIYQGLNIGDKVLAKTVDGQDIYWTVKDFYVDKTVTLDEANAKTELVKDSDLAAVIYEDEKGEEQVRSIQLSSQSVAKFNDGTYLDMGVIRTKVLGLVNNLRETAGLNPLVMNSDLNYAAEVRTEDIIKNGSTRHYVNGEWKAHVRDDEGTNINTVLDGREGVKNQFGENTASIPATARMTELVNEDFVANKFFTLWETSDAHKQNMLSAGYKYFGLNIGVTDKQRDGVNSYERVSEQMAAVMTLASDSLYDDPSKVQEGENGEWEYVGELTPVEPTPEETPTAPVEETPTVPVEEVTPEAPEEATVAP